jgi:hypothetical protein
MLPNTIKLGVRIRRSHRISKAGIFSVAVFILFSFVFRLLLPFGDEPDFGVKANQLKFNESFSVMSLLPQYFIKNLKVNSSCRVISTPFSLVSVIPSSGCSEPVEQAVLRLITTCIIFSPIFFVIIFEKSFLRYFYGREPLQLRMMAGLRINALTVTLPFSGFVYFAGLLSNEQLTLMLSTLALVFIDKKFFIATLMGVALIIDFGNGVVASFFFIAYFGVIFFYRKFGKHLTYSVLITLILMILIAGVSVLEYIPTYLGALSSKASSMLWVFTEGGQAGLSDKYPIVFRPLLTILSFVLFTPSYIKAPFAYIFFFFALLYSIRRKIRCRYKFVSSIELESLFLTFITTILVFTFAFPTYANGKYYVFMLPILFSFVIIKLGQRIAFTISALTTLLVIIGLLVFRLV